MMRDEMLKRRMRAGRPSPTPLFSGKVRKALDRLPEQSKNPLLHYLPVAAMALVAAAVIGVAFMSRLGPAGSGQFNALSGGEETATAGEQTTDVTPEATLETTLEPTPAPTPSESSEPSAAETAAPGTGDLTAAPTDAPDQLPTPAPTPTPNQNVAVITSAPQTTALSSTGDVVGGSGSGQTALGISCSYVHAVVNDTGTYYVIKGNATEELIEYCDRYYTASKNGPFTKYEIDLTVHTGLIFVLIDGLVDESFIGTTISEDKLNLLIAASDDDKPDGVYVRGLLSDATLEFAGKNGSFDLTIRNANPDFRPTSDFTILTRYAPDDGGKVQYFALPVKAR